MSAETAPAILPPSTPKPAPRPATKKVARSNFNAEVVVPLLRSRPRGLMIRGTRATLFDNATARKEFDFSELSKHKVPHVEAGETRYVFEGADGTDLLDQLHKFHRRLTP